MTAAEACSAVPAHCVNFVYENDAGRVLLALFKQIAHAAGAHTDEHFYEVRAGDRKERHVGFAGDRACQQSLSGSGRANQQYAFGNAAAQFLELLRLTQEFDDLSKFFLSFLNSSHIFERYLLLLRGVQARAALAETQRLVAAALHLPHHEDPERQQQHEGNGVDQNGYPSCSVFLVVVDVHAFLKHGVVQLLVVGRNHGVQFLIIFFVVAVQIVSGNSHGLDLSGVHIVHQVRIGKLYILTRLLAVDHCPKEHHHHDDDHPERCSLNIGIIHAFSLHTDWKRDSLYWTSQPLLWIRGFRTNRVGHLKNNPG